VMGASLSGHVKLVTRLIEERGSTVAER